MIYLSVRIWLLPTRSPDHQRQVGDVIFRTKNAPDQHEWSIYVKKLNTQELYHVNFNFYSENKRKIYLYIWDENPIEKIFKFLES